MPARRTPLVTGRPAISTPRQGDENALARGFDNTRERIEAIEAEVLMLGKFLDANAAVQDLLTLKAQLTRLTQTVNVLVATVAGSGEPEDNEGQLAGLIAEAAEMRKAVGEFNTAPPSGIEAALAELTKRVDGLEQGVIA